MTFIFRNINYIFNFWLYLILKSENSLVYLKCDMISKVVSFVTKQLKQKKKLLLKSLFVLLLWFSFLPQQNYFSINEVYAADSSQKQTQKQKLTEMDTFMEAISDIAFVLLWPLIALAWLAMDNSLIYGSFMGLDVSLWNVWQIVRSFANYTLWFMFLYWILYWNFSWKTWIMDLKLSDFLKKILLASVLIQASWFIMMVLVDISTIMTYGIWWMPTSILKLDPDKGWNDVKMFKMNVDLNLWDYHEKVENNWDLSSAILYYWSYSWGYIAPCETAEVKFDDGSQWFIIGREFTSFSWMNMTPWVCMYYGALVSFNDFYNKWWSGYLNELSLFKGAIESSKNNETQLKELVNHWIIYPLNTWKIPYLASNAKWEGNVNITIKDKNETYWWTVGCDPIWSWLGNIGVVSTKKDSSHQKGYCLYEKTDVSVSNIMDKAGSMTWPFSSLYSSMAVYSNLKTGNLWLWQKFVVTFINTCFAVMLILPLVALVVVLFARIWLLWMAIALSPFLVLVNLFKDVFKLPKDIDKYLNFWELIKLLLAPVLISFAVWMSLVFMKTLQTAIPTVSGGDPTPEQKQVQDNMSKVTWLTFDKWDIDYLWFIKIKIDNALVNFSWILTMFFWLWVTWFILFWAIKRTAVWKDIWQNLQDLWETALSTTPIIPIGKDWLSWRWLKNMDDQLYQNYKQIWKDRDDKSVKQLLGSWWSDYSKAVDLFFNNDDATVESAFGLKDSAAAFANTGEMIKRMSSIIDHGWWEKKADQIWSAYVRMLQSAKTESDIKSIIDHLNSKWVTTKKWITDKIWIPSFTINNKDYKLTLENGQYELKEEV